MSHYDNQRDNGWVTEDVYTDDYLVIDKSVYPLFTNTNDYNVYFRHDGTLLTYDPQRDGPTIDKEEAKDKYPEYFV